MPISNLFVRLAPALWLAILASTPVPAFANKIWDFRVLLDEEEVGWHRFELIEDRGESRITSEARIAAKKMLLITTYAYEHHDVEYWSGDCVRRLASSTNDNGTRHQVDVERRDGKTIVLTERHLESFDTCMLTFAYWKPAMLQQTQLLDSQTGEYIEVKIIDAGTESIVVRGVKTPAHRFEVRNKKLAIDLWYSAQNEWLALESKTERGQKLRYVLK